MTQRLADRMIAGANLALAIVLLLVLITGPHEPSSYHASPCLPALHGAPYVPACHPHR